MAYKALTFLIMLLGRIRDRLSHDSLRLRKDSPLEMRIPFFYIEEKSGALIICCDCGLAHRFFKAGLAFKAWPMRPPDYDYSWRLRPLTAKEEDGWTG